MKRVTTQTGQHFDLDNARSIAKNSQDFGSETLYRTAMGNYVIKTLFYEDFSETYRVVNKGYAVSFAQQHMPDQDFFKEFPDFSEYDFEDTV